MEPRFMNTFSYTDTPLDMDSFLCPWGKILTVSLNSTRLIQTHVMRTTDVTLVFLPNQQFFNDSSNVPIAWHFIVNCLLQ